MQKWQDQLKTLVQYILPQRWLSHAMHAVAQCRSLWFKNALIGGFMRMYKVDMSTAQEPNPKSYEHFNAFFTRALQPSARPLAGDPRTIASPVDGTISQMGSIENGTLLQVKGHRYTLQNLLPQSGFCTHFQHGAYATLYLSPSDYHRVHCPRDAQLTEVSYQPGSLFSVNPTSVRTVAKLFCRNERLCCIFSTDIGAMAVIWVGAFLVGSIETVWHGKHTPPHRHKQKRWNFNQNTAKFKKGEELGRFNMGSTVILLFEAGKLHWNTNLKSQSAVHMGQALGSVMP